MKKVQYEEMLPHEFEKALKEFPVAYVPVGSLEWHGRHMALGNDTIKAHGILVNVAKKYGGVVVPGTYWGHMGAWKLGCHPGLSPDTTDRLFTEIFKGLVVEGFKVVIGVTGHDIKAQLDSLQKAVDSITVPGKSAGFAMWEGSLNTGNPDVGMDHAAKWETSMLMYLRPDLVEMDRIKNEKPITPNLDTRSESGIGGIDPRGTASKEVGEKCISLIVDSIGKKAQELLKSIN